MTVLFPVRFRVDVWLKYAVVMAAALCAFAVLFTGALWVFSGTNGVNNMEGGSLALSSKQKFQTEAIGQGPLSLRAAFARGWVARLADEIQLLSYNSRPDQLLKEADLVVQLKKGNEKRLMRSGTMFSLKEAAEGEGLLFASEKSSLWARPTLLDGQTVLIEVGRVCAGGQEEKGQFLAQFQGFRSSAVLQSAAEVLASGSAFLQDLVVQKYGGKEFSSWKQKAALEVMGSSGLRVSRGDYLGLVGDRWQVVDFETLKGLKVVGQVASVSDQGVDLVLWDERGFSQVPCHLDVKKRAGGSLGAEFLPSAVRLRTGTQVSALFGKRRLILRAGDWLIKRQNGWRHLRSTGEVQAYLDRELKGELFVFDAIEKDAQGKAVLKGTLFDETRTWMQPVSVPVGVEKVAAPKSEAKRRSKKGVK